MSNAPSAAASRPGDGRVILLLALLVAAVAAAAWWRFLAPSPRGVARAYLAAEAAKNGGAMYDLLSADSKAFLGPKEKVAPRLILPISAILGREIPAGVKYNLGRRLKKVTLDPTGEGATAEAEIAIELRGEQRSSSGRSERPRSIPRTYYLVKEQGRWRVDAASVLPLPGSAPRAAPAKEGREAEARPALEGK
jgi:hypothetical protein